MNSQSLRTFLVGCGSGEQRQAQAAFATAQLMGFKAYNLLRMADVSLPVPPAFVLETGFCQDSTSRARAIEPSTWSGPLQILEHTCGLALGDARHPLLLSVRSGAAVSMPGMMETLLNIGLCETTLPGLLRLTGNPRLVWDAYRRLIATYGEVIRSLPGEIFEQEVMRMCGNRDERDLDFSEMRALTHRLLRVFEEASSTPFPQDPHVQLAEAIAAVMASWNSARAIEYRRVNQLPDDMGTAVTVQAMVFGNAGGRSGAGVGFTRDPATGEPQLWIDFLFNAQGEDVVSGRRSAHGHDELASALPDVWSQLTEAASILECQFADMQDFEFTVQEGRLFMLQTRSGKRTPLATARIAMDMFDAGLIDIATARQRTQHLDAGSLICHKVVAADGEQLLPIAHAASASTGVVCGEIALDGQRAKERRAAGAAVVLVRHDAETSDLQALEASVGMLTQRGARTAHAAVVARQLGKVCLVGCEALVINQDARTIELGGQTLHEGSLLTLDGNDGSVYAGQVQTVAMEPVELLARLGRLMDQV